MFRNYFRIALRGLIRNRFSSALNIGGLAIGMAVADDANLPIIAQYQDATKTQQAALRGADRTDREAFLLYGIEGFSLGEIAASTGRHLEAVRESVQRARDCVRSAPSIASEFHHELLVKHRS